MRSLLAALLILSSFGCGRHEGPGRIEGERLPAALVDARAARQAEARARIASRARTPAPVKQLLFGDLHVHSTISADAFMMSLPILQGEGSHPIADACDFARYCSAVDFWSINDHAESITPRRWRESKQSIRECNEIAGDPANPDVVAFLGWEWTQVGQTPEEHWGHKNVIFRETAEDRVPRRPIDSDSFTSGAMRQRPPLGLRLLLPLLDWRHRQRYFDLTELIEETRSVPRCPDGVDTRELPEECMEGAATPQVLFEKLAQWGFDSLVIPHGTSWGIYTPAGASWDKQLTAAQHDPERQTLIEVFSGHGNSEEYREWRAVDRSSGQAVCPPPVPGYEACCWRAGEIIRERCADPDSADCEERVREARRNFLAADTSGRHTVPGTDQADWKSCGTCLDCFLPAMNYRPDSSVQSIAARSNFDAPGEPARFRFGFIASSDNHSARPGTGYKELGRLTHTEARGARDATWRERMAPPSAQAEPVARSEAFDPNAGTIPPYQVLDFERQASFFLTGGLAVVHSEGRSRDAIWEALERREVYGTSGERILLWFDLLNARDGPRPMGSVARLGRNPRFRVRAVGSLEQKPGCPDFAVQGLSAERLERLCRGECYHPGDRRRLIDRIEVVRIRPQAVPGEALGPLIEDPWRSFPCPPDPEGCVVEFEDRSFAGSSREVSYYVRAIQPPTPTVNGGLERCELDAEGRCARARPCYGDHRSPPDDDCLADTEERAWSSPIYVRPD